MPLKKKKVAKKKVRKAAKKAVKKRPVSKKTAKKKPALKKKTSSKKKPVIKKVKDTSIGIVTHYFPHVRAAVIKLKAPLVIGDTLKLKGHTTDFTQTVTSMQIDRVDITSAKKGDEIGLLVNSRVRQGDKVYKA